MSIYLLTLQGDIVGIMYRKDVGRRPDTLLTYLGDKCFSIAVVGARHLE